MVSRSPIKWKRPEYTHTRSLKGTGKNESRGLGVNFTHVKIIVLLINKRSFYLLNFCFDGVLLSIMYTFLKIFIGTRNNARGRQSPKKKGRLRTFLTSPRPSLPDFVCAQPVI